MGCMGILASSVVAEGRAAVFDTVGCVLAFIASDLCIIARSCGGRYGIPKKAYMSVTTANEIRMMVNIRRFEYGAIK